MPRRALLATIITAAAGALIGVVFGAIVGRVIALFGDETVQTSVPMIFCATLGYFVGGASTIKGSLERFGAPRVSIATFAATLVLIVLVGGVSVTGQAGVVVILTAIVGLVLASVVGVAIGRPSNTPKHGINSPRTADAAKAPKAKQPEPDTVDVEAFFEPEPIADAAPRPPAAQAARRVSTEPPPRPRPLVTPIDAVDDEELADWMPEDESVPEPEPSPAPRPRRDRPLTRADAAPAPAAKKTPVTKKAPPPKKAAATKKAAPPAKKAPAIKKAPAPRKPKER